MSYLMITDKDRIADFVCPRANIVREGLHHFSALGLEREGELIGGVVYEHYTGVGGCVEMHMAGEGVRWMTPRFLKTAFFYPFVQLGCKVVRGRVPSTNVRALAFDMKLGFKLEHLIKDATPDGDQWLVAMWRNECRFLEK